MPIYIAVSVESHTTGAETRCNASRILFSNPSCCKILIQA